MKKNIVPIAFAFDNNLVMPACVCISSLLMSAKPDTFYDIFILHSPKEELTKEKLDLLPHYYSNCRLQYRKVDATFDDAFEIRGITTPTYYRLLIPDLIPEYDKVIYSDVDVIFRMDLSQLYQSDLAGYLLAATKDLGLNLSKEGKEYIVSTLGLIQGNYLQAGFIIMNNALMRKDKKEKQLKALAKQKYKHQDQDILNIACQGKVLYLPPCYNMTNYSYNYMLHDYDLVETLYTDEEIRFALSHGNIHYNGQKPWKGYCINFDIWWEYYRKSPFFDEKFYYDFFAKKLDEYDRLSLWKRIKILGRYFIHGRTDN
ncbi:glycosyltransferase family 8 protein [Phocaeicola barnesiae]|uniref:glycosyltransferase family 8 protein n=1 Tax=Phocaeicola barnesiae TaxID=376804 RepID=UPI0025A42C2E|nr:glycosyltransferase family 8 protein [Phocaeicola barnesiae]MDM8242693.1 glycosyltransferase family 8 protein [Phocaeicola barnesiae]